MTSDKYETLLLIAQGTKSGLSLQEAIRLTVGDSRDKNNRKLLKFAEHLDKGMVPKDAVRKCGLPNSLANLLEAALSSGDFAGSFEELTALEMGRSLTIQKITQALAYPFLLMFCTIAVTLVLLVSTVPKFEAIFISFDTQLPFPTLILVKMSHLACNPISWLIMLLAIVVLIFGVPIMFPRFWFCVPILGHIFRSMYSSRLLRQLGRSIQRNLPLDEALEYCGKTMRCVAYRKDCRLAAADSRKGMDMTEIVIRYYWLFPTWLAPIVATDGSGPALVKSLTRAADTVEQQKETSVLFLQVMSLPIFILFAFTAISFFVITLFLPLMKLMTSLSSC